MEIQKPLIAVNGCLHGDFCKLAPLLSPNTRLLMLLGDLQLLSAARDLSTCSIPYKYTCNGDIKRISDFHRILKNDPRDELAQKINSIKCILGIGGNHENMGLLDKLPFGGFVTENFFYMGTCNVVTFHGLKIAGISGIYKQEDVYRAREHGFKQTAQGDFNWWRQNKVSSYHVRFFELLPLLLYDAAEGETVDFVMSHDWPQNVFHNRDPKIESRLLKVKPFFRRDIASGKLGSPLYDLVMDALRPSTWFAAHLHIKYSTTINYSSAESATIKHSDCDTGSATIKHSDINTESATIKHSDTDTVTDTDTDSTDFIALDKLVPGRLQDGVSQFEFPVEDDPLNYQADLGNCGVELDTQFLAIQRWCYSNQEKIMSLVDPKSVDFAQNLARIRELYVAEKETLKAENGTLKAGNLLLKPYFSQDPLEYTLAYMEANLGLARAEI